MVDTTEFADHPNGLYIIAWLKGCTVERWDEWAQEWVEIPCAYGWSEEDRLRIKDDQT